MTSALLRLTRPGSDVVERDRGSERNWSAEANKGKVSFYGKTLVQGEVLFQGEIVYFHTERATRINETKAGATLLPAPDRQQNDQID